MGCINIKSRDPREFYELFHNFIDNYKKNLWDSYERMRSIRRDIIGQTNLGANEANDLIEKLGIAENHNLKIYCLVYNFSIKLPEIFLANHQPIYLNIVFLTEIIHNFVDFFCAQYSPIDMSTKDMLLEIALSFLKHESFENMA